MRATRSVVQLGGRLGNLLFEVAWGLDLRRRTGASVVYVGDLAPSLLADLVTWTGPLEWADPAEVDTLTGGPGWPGKLGRQLRQRLPVGFRRHILQDSSSARGWHLRVRHPAYWSGYWQSLKYWTGSDEELRAGLWYRGTLPSELEAAARMADEPGSCSVHLRRGDYVGNPSFPSLDPDYHRRAIEAIRPEGPVLVFSDDPGWCRTALDLGLPFTVVEGGTPAQDLALMTRCEHHVIANSTYSWWGARLGGRPGRTAAPERWFATFGSVPPRSELYPAPWMVLPS